MATSTTAIPFPVRHRAGVSMEHPTGRRRLRSRPRPTPASLAFTLLLEVADVWMLRKMLLGLRDRAEAGPDGADPAPEPGPDWG
jgi:hypothetical protein